MTQFLSVGNLNHTMSKYPVIYVTALVVPSNAALATLATQVSLGEYCITAVTCSEVRHVCELSRRCSRGAYFSLFKPQKCEGVW